MYYRLMTSLQVFLSNNSPKMWSSQDPSVPNILDNRVVNYERHHLFPVTMIYAQECPFAPPRFPPLPQHRRPVLPTSFSVTFPLSLLSTSYPILSPPISMVYSSRNTTMRARYMSTRHSISPT